MSTWIFIVAATAVGGALVVWNAVTRTKHYSELMLNTYSQMLAEARKQKADDLARQAEQTTSESQASSD